MEILLEIICELFLEGAAAAAESKRTPKLLRCIAATVIALFYAAFILMLVIIGIQMIKNDQIAGGIIFIAVGVFVTAICLIVIRSYKRKHKK